MPETEGRRRHFHQQRQHKTAEQSKIQSPAQQEGQAVGQPHLAAPRSEGQEKQGGCRQQPEQQVCRRHGTGPPPTAEGPHPVEDQPQQAARSRPPQEQGTLLQDPRGHGQRSSRAQKPSRSPLRSSS